MRLIDADALIEKIVNTPSEVQNKDIPLTTQYDGAAFRQFEILGMIDDASTIEPERKKGHWYKPEGYPRDSYRYICTNCQDVAYFVTGNNGKKHKDDNPKCGYRFCPNCGCRMEKEN